MYYSTGIRKRTEIFLPFCVCVWFALIVESFFQFASQPVFGFIVCKRGVDRICQRTVYAGGAVCFAGVDREGDAKIAGEREELFKVLGGIERFCAGNIAPDCNVENADWTDFTPSRQVTHWMNSERKLLADCDAFLRKYFIDRRDEITSAEESSFLLGYYAHLIADAAFQQYIRDEKRVRASWERFLACDDLREKAAKLPVSFDSVKKLIPKGSRIPFNIKSVPRRVFTFDKKKSEYLK